MLVALNAALCVAQWGTFMVTEAYSVHTKEGATYIKEYHRLILKLGINLVLLLAVLVMIRLIFVIWHDLPATHPQGHPPHGPREQGMTMLILHV
jgi:hypothetical protein